MIYSMPIYSATRFRATRKYVGDGFPAITFCAHSGKSIILFGCLLILHISLLVPNFWVRVLYLLPVHFIHIDEPTRKRAGYYLLALAFFVHHSELLILLCRYPEVSVVTVPSRHS